MAHGGVTMNRLMCSECRYCNGVSVSDSAFKVTCQKNGSVKVSTDFTDSFMCKDYAQKPPAPKEQRAITFVLKSGQTITVNTDVELDDIADHSGDRRSMTCGNTLVFLDDVSACFVRNDK